jgi:hypothetical protein
MYDLTGSIASLEASGALIGGGIAATATGPGASVGVPLIVAGAGMAGVSLLSNGLLNKI